MTIFSKKNKNYYSIIGIFSIICLLFLGSPLVTFLSYKISAIQTPNEVTFFISRIFYWLCLALLWIFALKVEKQKFLIWTEEKYKIWIYFVFIVAIYLILVFGLQLVKMITGLISSYKVSPQFVNSLKLLRENKFLLFFTALTAGVTEELIFRGYLQPRFEIIFKSGWFGILLPSMLFGFLHYGYGTLLNVTAAFFIGLIFSIFYRKYRNLKVLILFHFLWDLLLLLFYKQ